MNDKIKGLVFLFFMYLCLGTTVRAQIKLGKDSIYLYSKKSKIEVLYIDNPDGKYGTEKRINIDPETKLGIIHSDKWKFSGLISSTGKIILPLEYDYISSVWDGSRYIGFPEFINGYARVKKKGKWGFIDKTGKVIIPTIYNDCWNFQENGLALVVLNHKYGFIDRSGKTIVPCIYNNAYIFSKDGIAPVVKDRKLGYVNTEGQLIIPCIYDDETSRGKTMSDGKYCFKNGKAVVRKNGKYGLIDKSGKLLTPFKYDYLYREFQKKEPQNSYWGTTKSGRKEIYWYLDDEGHEYSTREARDQAMNNKENKNGNVVNDQVKKQNNTKKAEQATAKPVIEWKDMTTTTDSKLYKVKYGVKSDSRIESVSINVNGSATRDINLVTSTQNNYEYEKNIVLNEGENTVTVIVRNAGGTAELSRTITCKLPIRNQSLVQKEKRLALVVGNGNYKGGNALENPVNDATDIAAKLRSMGFDVILSTDASLETMDKDIKQFGERAKNYQVALFYYAGHGIQSKGINYLLPTSVPGNLTEVDLKYKCIDANSVLAYLEDARCKFNLVILDACRNDPFSRKWRRGTGSHGLEQMSGPKGTIIAFSTKPNFTAEDGNGQRNSPYTKALLKHIDDPTIDVLTLFTRVTNEVMLATGESQEPWFNTSLRETYFLNKK